MPGLEQALAPSGMPDKLHIKATEVTPEVSFDATTGVLELKGKSFWENTQSFYAPVFAWLDSYAQQPAQSTVLSVQFEYFNTATAKTLVDLMRRLEKIGKESGKAVSVDWHFFVDDEDLQEAGEEYASLVSIPFNLKPFN